MPIGRDAMSNPFVSAFPVGIIDGQPGFGECGVVSFHPTSWQNQTSKEQFLLSLSFRKRLYNDLLNGRCARCVITSETGVACVRFFVSLLKSLAEAVRNGCGSEPYSR